MRVGLPCAHAHVAFIGTEQLLLIKLNYRTLIYPPRLDMCTEKILLVTMGARMEGQACADLKGRDLFSTAWRIESI